MRRNILSLSLMTILLSSLVIFQNCGKGGTHSSGGALPAQASLDGTSTTTIPTTSTSQNKTTPESQAQDIYKRLSGVTLDPTDSVYTQMVSYINAGQRAKAAELATHADTFYTVTVRDFANKMSTREGTTLAPLSDFVATVIGAVRDNVDAKQLLSGNFYYRAVNESGITQDIQNDIVTSNKHYEQLEANEVNLVSALKREEGQKMLSPSGVTVHSDAAGLLTTRAFMFAHANAGTNRRIIEYIFKIFQCATIDSWANTTNPDSHVGREIGRFPAEEYNNKCKGCHTGMDGMRPATAYYDFFVQDAVTKTGFTKYKYTYTTDPDPNDATKTVPVPAAEQLVPAKFRRGSDTFPLGYIVKDNEWINYASDTFGWNTDKVGQGMKELGEMIAYSDGFRRCMVKRVFSSVCKYDLTSADSGLVNKLADDFKTNGYNLKDLFINVSVRPECLGVEN